MADIVRHPSFDDGERRRTLFDMSGEEFDALPGIEQSKLLAVAMADVVRTEGFDALSAMISGNYEQFIKELRAIRGIPGDEVIEFRRREEK